MYFNRSISIFYIYELEEIGTLFHTKSTQNRKGIFYLLFDDFISHYLFGLYFVEYIKFKTLFFILLISNRIEI